MGGEDRRSECLPTFGVGEDDGHESRPPVGDLDGEIPHPELVNADYLPRPGRRRGVFAAGEANCHGKAQQGAEAEEPPLLPFRWKERVEMFDLNVPQQLLGLWFVTPYPCSLGAVSESYCGPAICIVLRIFAI